MDDRLGPRSLSYSYGTQCVPQSEVLAPSLHVPCTPAVMNTKHKGSSVCLLQAAAFFHMKITHIPVDEVTRKVDVKAMKRAISSKTCMVSTGITLLFLVFPSLSSCTWSFCHQSAIPDLGIMHLFLVSVIHLFLVFLSSHSYSCPFCHHTAVLGLSVITQLFLAFLLLHSYSLLFCYHTAIPGLSVITQLFLAFLSSRSCSLPFCLHTAIPGLSVITQLFLAFLSSHSCSWSLCHHASVPSFSVITQLFLAFLSSLTTPGLSDTT